MHTFKVSGLVLASFLLVHCTTGLDPKYTLGGTVSGLTGTLVLKNGGDDLTLTENGSFTFDEKLKSERYSVKVKTQPSSQVCTVTDGKGTIGYESVSNVNVVCVAGAALVKSWTHPSSLSDNFTPSGEDAQLPGVAMDDNGNTIIVWNQNDGSNMQIYKSEYRNGAWTHPSNLADHISIAGQNSFDPGVAMDNDGNAIIVWQGSDGANEQIFKAEYRNGAWTFPTGLADNISPDGQSAQNPVVDMDDLGNIVIAWAQSDGNNAQVFRSEYRNGAWVHPLNLADNVSADGEDAFEVHVKMDNDENTILAWPQFNGAVQYIYMTDYRNDAWNAIVKISPDIQNCSDLSIAMDNNGNAIIVWTESDGSDDQVFKSEYRNAAWTHPLDLADNISPDGEQARLPVPAMSEDGTALIVWQQNNGTINQVFMSEYRNGAWVHPADLSAHINVDGEAAEEPSVAMDDSGDAIVVWRQYDGVDDQIYKAEYRNDEWIFPSGLLDNISPDVEGGNSPKVAMDNDGNAVILWRQNDGSDNQMFKSEYR